MAKNIVKFKNLYLILSILLVPITFRAQNLAYTMDRLQVISSENLDSLEQIASINTSSNLILDIEWSPNGNYLAILGGSDKPYVEIWSFQQDDMSLSLITTFVPQLVTSIHWLPDSTQIAIHGQQYVEENLRSYVAIWNALSGEIIQTLLDTQVEPNNCCDPLAQPIVGWSSDYAVAATLVGKHTIELTTGQLFAFRDSLSLFTTDYTEEPIYGTIVNAEWSPHDRYIAIEHATQDQYRFHIIDAQTLQSVLYFFGEDYWTCNLAWSPDDTTLAVISERSSAGLPSSTTQIHLYPIDEPVCYGGCGIELWMDSTKLHSRCNPPFAWSPNSDIVSIGTTTTLDFYEPAELNLIHALSDANIFALDWHPTQKIVTIGGIDSKIRLWSVPESD
jgi:WD40 repeat protein